MSFLKCNNEDCELKGTDYTGECSDCGAFICNEGVDMEALREYQSSEYPSTVHVKAEEVGEQVNNWPAGDLVYMKCLVCGASWEKELPQ